MNEKCKKSLLSYHAPSTYSPFFLPPSRKRWVAGMELGCSPQLFSSPMDQAVPTQQFKE